MMKLTFMNLKILSRAGIVLMLVLTQSCTESEYSKLIKTEMAKGIVYDSLLFTMKFGQQRQQFFDTCWKLNQKGIVANGPGNNWVKYKLPLKKNAPSETEITMYFFGDFNDEKIMTGMDFQFYYNAWSLWNKNLQADKLMPVVMDSLKKWYPGNDFIKVPIEKDSTHLFVKIDGNRRIVLKPIDDKRLVKAKIDDLRYVLDDK